MYIDTSTTKGKYTRYLLRQSYREGGKVKHRTIANLSHCTKEEIEAIRLALKHKDKLVSLVSTDHISFSQGISVGTGWTAYDIARQIGIVDVLGRSRRGEQVLWMVVTRIIDYGIGLPAIRMPRSPAVLPPLRMSPFQESDLYDALEWASTNQSKIEDRLFKISHSKKKIRNLFLYNITGSYLKGKDSELAAFGFDSVGRKGRDQIAVGLLCDEAGIPLSVGIYSDDLRNSDILGSIVRSMSERFGCNDVTFVGNRAMITDQQAEDLARQGFHYINTMTRAQLKDFLDDGSVRLGMSGGIKDTVIDKEKRCIFLQDPAQTSKVWTNFENKRLSLEQEVVEQNSYLMEHPRANVQVALKKIQKSCNKNKLSGWIVPIAEKREILLKIDRSAMKHIAQLEASSGLETDLKKKILSKEKIQARFNDLELINWAFITGNSTGLEKRYVFERTENRSPGYLLVVMLAYRIIKELAQRWRSIGVTVENGLKELDTFCSTEMVVDGRPMLNKIPKPRKSVEKLLDAAGVSLNDTGLVDDWG
jgi:hypothetical protein